jgi:integrase
MRYVSRGKDGRWRIQAPLPDGRRFRCSLGSIPRSAAESIGRHIHQLISCKASGAVLPVDTAAWLGNAPAALLQQLIDRGIVDEGMVRPASVTLGEFMELYFSRPDDRSRATISQLKIARNNVLAFLGTDQSLRSITTADAEDFRRWLAQPRGDAGERWQPATVNRICGRVKEMFGYARRRGLVTDNPFAELKGLTVRANPNRQFRMDRQLTQVVLEACPDIDWKLIFALPRFGGMRCPSEVLQLRWDHIDWQFGRIHVPCKKTERYEGREWREIPLFPELYDLLCEARKSSSAHPEWVVGRYPDNRNANVGVHFKRILRRAGIAIWPKLLQNLRFTRANELIEDGWPEHVVQAWIGHSSRVSKEHYRGVTDDHFRRAAGLAPLPPAGARTADGDRVRSGSTRSGTELHAAANPMQRLATNRTAKADESPRITAKRLDDPSAATRPKGAEPSLGSARERT